ncbi:DUF805 domain-containing protein [Lacticaseibacillus porcinae]|uniref:DUF805 domain-containing protein n=1 Tax=Lacticaseibacillus porcinae TaxID=1123687 RepID=UPI0013DE02EF|nr:DUF805 domain-containing protein [Lacticaseibacillus porcinae]
MAKATESVAAATGNRYYGAKGVGAIGAFFGNYVNFTGRSSRREYWWWTLWYALLSLIALVGLGAAIVMSAVDWTHLDNLSELTGKSLIPIFILLGIYLLFALAIVIPGLSLTIRRFRDAGVPWWVYVILLAIEAFAGIVYGGDSNTATFISAAVGITCFVIEVLPSKNSPE